VVARYDNEQRERSMTDGVDVVEHQITMLAIDGLMMGQMLGFMPPEHLRQAIMKRLEARTRAFPIEKPTSPSQNRP